MKIFITGGTGNIGQYVTLAAAKKGHRAIVLSRSPENYPTLANMENVTLVNGEMTEYKKLSELVKGCDAVIQIALGWGNEPVSMLENDTAATVNLLEISEKAGVAKFIYTSSTAAMGKMRSHMDETVMNLPVDLYGSTKSASESYLLGFSKYYGEERTGGNTVSMKRNIIRPGYTFSSPPYEDGSSQSDTRFRDITDAVVNDSPVCVIKNDGTQFISSGQIAELYISLLESELNEEVFLALGKTYITWERIAKIALEEYPRSKSVIELDDRGWGDSPMLYNVSKMERVFGLAFDEKAVEAEIRSHVKWNLEQSFKRK